MPGCITMVCCRQFGGVPSVMFSFAHMVLGPPRINSRIPSFRILMDFGLRALVRALGARRYLKMTTAATL